MRIDYTPKLTFDDVLLEPQYSDIASRDDIDITTVFPGARRIYPIISANMDYVTGVDMTIAMENAGALGILNRFEHPETQLRILNMEERRPNYLVISLGVRNFKDQLWMIDTYQPQAVCIDVAHGDHSQVVKAIKLLKSTYPVKVIAGNVATATGFQKLALAGADAIKVGIGPGSVCTTREVTGAGVPQLSAIIECAREKNYHGTFLIADGGINSSGDIVKALAAGADAVMLGRLLAGHEECPGDKMVSANGRSFKPYRGQAMLGANQARNAPEGIAGYVPYRGKVAETLKTLIGGIRSGFSYIGARNLEQLQEKASFITISGATKNENSTRVLQEIA